MITTEQAKKITLNDKIYHFGHDLALEDYAQPEETKKIIIYDIERICRRHGINNLGIKIFYIEMGKKN